MGNSPRAPTAAAPFLEEIIAIVKRHVEPPWKLYLYGSWAKGNAVEGSDVDVALDAGKPVPPERWRAVLAEIEGLKTLRTIQAVDFHRVGPELKAGIARYGKIIHELP